MSPRALLLVPLALAAGCSPDEPPDGPPDPATTAARARSAVLVTLDTTRQDALSCYGGRPGLTPNLDAVAAAGTLFVEARATAPITLPSHASMLTGLYPLRHGLRVNGVARLPAAADTLAERARAAGFETAAFVAAVVLDRTYGLDQGFEVWDEVERTVGADVQFSSHYERRPAKAVVDAALGWLERRDADRPFLCWLHFFDPHQPYETRPNFLPAAGQSPYLAEVAYVDRQVGRFLAALDDRGLLDGTAVAVVGDHGEAFGDHGEDTHGALCYDAVMKVPLIVRLPGGPRGRRSTANVSVADVFPTLCAALGLRTPEGLDGRSLVDPVPPDRGVYLESYYGRVNFGWSPLAGWVEGGRKYLHSSAPELYDLAADPAEAENLLAGAAPPATEPFRAAIAALSARPRLAYDDAGAASAERVRQLAALGYVVGGSARDLPDPLDAGDRNAPGQSAGELARIQAAWVAAESGDARAAEAAWAAVLDENPHNTVAVEQHGLFLLRLGRLDAAEARLRAALADAPERPMTWLNLGVCVEQLDRRDEAAACYRRALELDPGNVPARENFERVMRALGREFEARNALRDLGIAR